MGIAEIRHDFSDHHLFYWATDPAEEDCGCADRTDDWSYVMQEVGFNGKIRAIFA
jgi:hypothetical protein